MINCLKNHGQLTRRPIFRSKLFCRKYIELMVLICIVLACSLSASVRNIAWENELSLWQDVIKKSPIKFRGYHNLGSAYMKMGRYGLAIDQYNMTLKINPDAERTHNNLGYIHYRMGDIDMAIREYMTALNLDSHNAEFHYNIAIAYDNKRLTKDAVRHYQTAVRLQPQHYKALYNLGILYAKQGLLDQALMKFKSSLNIKPAQPKALYNLGLVYEQLARSKELRVERNAKEKLINQAISAYQRALEIDPGFIHALERIKKLRAKQRKALSWIRPQSTRRQNRNDIEKNTC